MKEAVAGELATPITARSSMAFAPATSYTESGRLTVHLAREFGFCYGVDRAVDYAYQARRRFPARNVFLTGEIIHNPHVNERLAGRRHPVSLAILASGAMRSVRRTSSSCRRSASRSRTWRSSRTRAARSSTRRAARSSTSGRTWSGMRRKGSLGHPRQGEARGDPRDRVAGAEVSAGAVPRRARSRRGGDRVQLHTRAAATGRHSSTRFAECGLARLRSRSRPRPDRLREPDDDADDRVAGDRRDVPRRRCATRYGEAALPSQFRAFDTICSATQERQDAVDRAARRASGST